MRLKTSQRRLKFKMVTKNLHLGNGRKYMKSDKESEWINIEKMVSLKQTS